MNDNLLNGINIDGNLQPYTTTAVDDGITLIDDGTSSENLSSQIFSIPSGQGVTTSTYGNWWTTGNANSITSSPSWNDTGINISDGLLDALKNNFLEIKEDEILDDIKKFCNDFCFLGCEGLCDGDTKSQCPLWNRLKCEGKV